MPANYQSVVVHAMDPCKVMYIRAYKSPWANSTSSVRGSPFALQAHLSILLSSHPASFKLCRPMRQSQQQPILGLMGQCQPVIQILRRMQWAHPRPAYKSLQVIIGQLYLLDKWATHSHHRPMQASHSVAIPLASHYAGPCSSLGSSLF